VTAGRPERIARAGFTLVELMIVLVVLAIIAAVVLPNIGSSADTQVTSAARVVAGDLELARSMALTTQRPHALVFRLDRAAYKVVANYLGEPYNSVDAVTHPVKSGEDFEVVLADLGGMGTVVVTDVDLGGDSYVTFSAEGEPSSGGSVTIAAGASEAVVSVEALTGAVSVARTGG
jgi:type II secretion system protein H